MYNFLKKINKQTKVQNKKKVQNNSIISKPSYFNKDMNYYVCSFGGSGSTILFNYLSNFGNVYHIHDRYPPNELTYIGNHNTTEEVYSEWFNKVKIDQDNLKNYKVIYIYRNPLKVIYSRCVSNDNPNVAHLQHIMCNNNGNIYLRDVLLQNKDLYELEDFFDNYTQSEERNYKIYCVKYEDFWNNINVFNKTLEIPDVKELYPVKNEHPKPIYFYNTLSSIYSSLINKMNKMKFIEII